MKNLSQYFMLDFHYSGLSLLQIIINQRRMDSQHFMFTHPFFTTFQFNDTIEEEVEELTNII